MSYIMAYQVNGFQIKFSDDGIVLDPETMDLENPEYIAALDLAQRAYESINIVHTIGDYGWTPGLKGYADSDLQNLLDLCDSAESQPFVQLPTYVRESIARIRDEKKYRTGTLARPAPLPYHSPKKRGFVYLLKSSEGQYKIGRTKNPDSRIKTFGVQLPFKVEYEHLIECSNMYKLEKSLHHRFDDKRIEGEWFDLSADDVAYIKTLGGES